MTCQDSRRSASALRIARARGAGARTPRAGIAVLAAVALGVAGSAGANDLSAPVPVEQAQPDVPTNQFGWPIEGWVKVRYSVLADGTTADVRVVESMPPSLPTKSAVSAVERWTFEPATAGGEPIDWHNNESVIVFDHEDVPLEPTPMFSQGYLEIVELIKQQDFAKAQRQNQVLQTRVFRLAEIGLAQAQAAVIHVALKNPHDAYEAVVRATDPRIPVLEGAGLADALRYRFGLAIELGRYADALETRERLAALEPLPDDDPTAAHVETISQALASDVGIAVKGRVVKDAWHYTPTRRTFTFAEIDGAVRGIELECDRRKAVLEYADDAEWSIPESWGACEIFVNARRNTTFSLVEFP